MNKSDIKDTVKEKYGAVARGESAGRNVEGASCCGPSSCCGGGKVEDAVSKSIGYSDAELDAVPDGANLGLGCGNPTALASLKAGEFMEMIKNIC